MADTIGDARVQWRQHGGRECDPPDGVDALLQLHGDVLGQCEELAVLTLKRCEVLVHLRHLVRKLGVVHLLWGPGCEGAGQQWQM